MDEQRAAIHGVHAESESALLDVAHPHHQPLNLPLHSNQVAAVGLGAGVEMRSDTSRTVTQTQQRFEHLFDSLYSDLFGVAYRVLGDGAEAEDVLQDAFLKLSETRALLARPDAEVRAWLRRVCLNHSFNRLRNSHRARERAERVGRLDPARGIDEGGPPADVLRAEAQREVRQALATLPEHQRNCLVLRHSGYAYAEIAETLDMPIGSVGVLLGRAERAFRTAYERRQGTNP